MTIRLISKIIYYDCASQEECRLIIIITCRTCIAAYNIPLCMCLRAVDSTIYIYMLLSLTIARAICTRHLSGGETLCSHRRFSEQNGRRTWPPRNYYIGWHRFFIYRYYHLILCCRLSLRGVSSSPELIQKSVDFLRSIYF